MTPINLERVTMKHLFIFIFGISFVSCQTPTPTKAKASFTTSQDSIRLGKSVNIGGKPHSLSKGSLNVGDDFVAIALKHGMKMSAGVSIINVVPSVDTAVCEEQTHVLGESPLIKPQVQRFTISRDLPMAQERFAKAAKLTNITYFSDYKNGSFGNSTGIMIKGPELHARGVIVTDKSGKIHHIQFVPDITQLPNMAYAIKIANSLL